jgi:hypothetical protein
MPIAILSFMCGSRHVQSWRNNLWPIGSERFCYNLQESHCLRMHQRFWYVCRCVCRLTSQLSLCPLPWCAVCSHLTQLTGNVKEDTDSSTRLARTCKEDGAHYRYNFPACLIRRACLLIAWSGLVLANSQRTEGNQAGALCTFNSLFSR